MKYYINETFNNGIVAYINKKSGLDYSLAHVYELTIVECLVKLYGEISILNPYKTKSEKSLRDNLKTYGLDDVEVRNFFVHLDEYGAWLKSNSRMKIKSLCDIEYIIMKMVLLKNIYVGLSEEDIKYFDDFFYHRDLRIKKIYDIASDNIDVVDLWERKKKIYLKKGGILLEEVEPDLLTTTLYRNHGISINEIKQLSNLKINEVNNMIIDEKNKKEKKLYNKFNTLFSSGNGFVDTLVLLSIMLTEIMIGFIIAVTIARLK